MGFQLIKRDMIVGFKHWHLPLHSVQQSQGINWTFNVVFPLLRPAFSLNHLYRVLHQRGHLLSPTWLLMYSYCCWLQVTSHLDDPVISTHYLFLGTWSDDFIELKVILPERIICRLAEDDVWICKHCLIDHLIKVSEKTDSEPHLFIRICSSFVLMLFWLLLLLFVVRNLGFCEKILSMLQKLK